METWGKGATLKLPKHVSLILFNRNQKYFYASKMIIECKCVRFVSMMLVVLSLRRRVRGGEENDIKTILKLYEESKTLWAVNSIVSCLLLLFGQTIQNEFPPAFLDFPQENFPSPDISLGGGGNPFSPRGYPNSPREKQAPYANSTKCWFAGFIFCFERPKALSDYDLKVTSFLPESKFGIKPSKD